MGVNPEIPAAKPKDYLLYKPIQHNDGGEATKHNIKVDQQKELIKKQKESK